MKGSLFLNDVITTPDMLLPGRINIIEAGTSAGKTYFSDLIRAGVRIYEYTPGFNHGKMVLADGVYASVGSANLDYRSLYLHYECGALFIGGDVATGLARDFDTIFADSAEVPMPRHRLNYLHTVWDQLLRLLAPLM